MKRLVVGLMGGTVVLIGAALLVLPGPGLPIVAVGLTILATEFLWARRALKRAKGAVAKVRRRSGLKAWRRRVANVTGKVVTRDLP
jgi:tellurite resistance protein TerC